MKLITANRLSDGRVIYVGANDEAVEAIADAATFDEDWADTALALAAARPDVFVNPYLVEVRDHTPSGRDRLKETIRSTGPTVGHSLDHLGARTSRSAPSTRQTRADMEVRAPDTAGNGL